MGDLFVHKRMKECCRKTLADIDKRKRDIKGSGLFGMDLASGLGEKPVPEARALLASTAATGGGPADTKLAATKRRVCVIVASRHAEHHRSKGEKTEADFWRDLAAALDGQELPKAKPLPPGADITKKAQDKISEYKKSGIKYSLKHTPGTSECSLFVHDVLTSSGVDVPYTTSEQFSESEYFEETTQPEPGDVIWQPGHVGIYTGTNDKGQPMGAQMGKHGPAIGPWGEGGWFEGGDKTKYYHPKGL